ncbi:MAG: PAS domain S-box protein [Proteobacteria bacterium]|nr:PAS domain S-box protein [Pseudomonadota bacterium]
MDHTSTQNVAEKSKAKAILQAQQERIWTQTDKMFGVLLPLQWAAAMVFAVTVSPIRWEGQYGQIHYHVWTALVLGGVITLLPTYAALKWSGQTATRHIVAVGQMLMSALLIHMTGGRIETHFHVFGSLAFLAFYRDWRVLVPATVVIAADHLIRGFLWPQSVFGVLTATPWRSIEHAAWVLFEDAVLVRSILVSVREMEASSDQQARLEEINENIEYRVLMRTAELKENEERFHAIVDSAPLAVVQMGADGACLYSSPRYEAIVGRTKGELSGKGWMESVHPDDRKTLVRADAPEGAPGKEVRLMPSTGQPKRMIARVWRLSSSTGQPMGQAISFEEAEAKPRA